MEVVVLGVVVKMMKLLKQFYSGTRIKCDARALSRLTRPLRPLPYPGASAKEPTPSSSSTLALPLVFGCVLFLDFDLSKMSASLIATKALTESSSRSILAGGELLRRAASRPRGNAAAQSTACSSGLLTIACRVREGDGD